MPPAGAQRLAVMVLLCCASAQAIFCPWYLGSTLGSAQDTLKEVVAPTTASCAEACVSAQGCTACVWYSSNRCVLKSGDGLLRQQDPFHKFGSSGAATGRGAEFERHLQRCGEEGTADECRIVASVHVKDCLLNL
eukprot:TRINITY_DN21732_c0_g1_i1.p2 TRINITY_DN21732_c0_g1~~TRINITY_DN21732_c0_g1_i1.p2  ORF type:complete len:135 (+),score=29.06 TRINITY_DN21732_c0_g1_i1:115-519(+)